MTTARDKLTNEIRRGKALVAALSALGALCLYVIVDSDAAPGQSGTLVCVKLNKPRKGSVRIPTNGLCHTNERGLFLNKEGPQGPPGTPGTPGGPPGPQGIQGIQGPPGPIGYERVSLQSSAQTDGSETQDVDCPSGKSVLGGGFDVAVAAGDEDKIFATNSFPLDSNTWRVSAAVAPGAALTGSWTLTAWATCATAS